MAKRRVHSAPAGASAANYPRFERCLSLADVIEQRRHGRRTKYIANRPIRAALFCQPLQTIVEFEFLHELGSRNPGRRTQG